MENLPTAIDDLIADLEDAVVLSDNLIARYPGDKTVKKLAKHLSEMLDAARGNYDDEQT